MPKKLNTYRRLFAYLRPYRSQLIIAYGGMIAAVVFQLAIPQLIKTAIDDALAQGALRGLLWSSGLIVGAATLRALATFCRLYYAEWLTHRVSYDLKNDFYNAVQFLPFAFHDQAHTGDLMSRATSDIGETERFVGIGGVDLLSTMILLVGVIGSIFVESGEHVQLAWLSMIPLVVLTGVAVRFGYNARTLFKMMQEQLGTISKIMQESLTGIQLVKAFAREEHEFNKFEKENQEWFRRRVNLISTWANNWPFMTFLVSVSIFLLLWVGGPLAMDGGITVGSLFAMISYVLLLNGPVQRVGFLANLAASAGSAASRVFEIMDTPHDIQEVAQPQAMERANGRIEFKNVSFGYSADRQILHDLTFEVEPGQTIALIGPTGSGKSSVTNLIPRFYDPSAGQVLLDGVDIRELGVADLRQQIAMVLQDSFLFSDSIAENIAYGRVSASFEQIQEAAKAARAHDFILRFPDGYQTMVGERGVTLSGGQKQRVAIARALLADPRILILDDSTSSVDTETEFLIQQALETLMEGRTTFVIAQRLLTLKSADHILVLDHGRIVERGTHDELLANHGLYREIYDLQLKDQEELSTIH